MKRRDAYWTCDADDDEYSYYFAPNDRQQPPYRQRRVTAIIDVAADGSLAGVELIDDMPPPPVSQDKTREQGE